MRKIMDMIDDETWFMIDVDGVLIDTVSRLQANYPEIVSGKMNWHTHIYESTQINGSLDIIKEIQDKIKKLHLLTKNAEFEEEYEKTMYLRHKGIVVPIVSVPLYLPKSHFVPPKHFNGNVILVDDSLENLIDWENNGGKSILFDSGCNNTSEQYPKIKSLEFLRDVAKKY